LPTYLKTQQDLDFGVGREAVPKKIMC